MPKFLILDSMPENADPADYLAAGPWCFVNREPLFPGWEQNFTFAPEPLANPNALPQAANMAKILCISQIPKIAALLHSEPERLPQLYWQTLLLPWAISVATQLIERKLRCDMMIKSFGHLNLTVPILQEIDIKFENEQDFVLRGQLGNNYNFYIFSQLLQENWPGAWKKQVVAKNIAAIDQTPKKNWPCKFKNFMRACALALLFPRLKGMSFTQAFKFSLALRHPCKRPDHSLNLTAAYSDTASLDANISLKNPFAYFKKALPSSIARLEHDPAQIKPDSQKSWLRVAGINAYEDAEYRQKLAYWRAAGNRLGYAQHGGNYGQARIVCDSALVEYSQDVFFTWGWQRHGKGNFAPMPSPQLSKIHNAWHGANNGDLIFVGAEMASHAYRLESRPTPLQFLKYRQAKADFFACCGPDIQKLFLYRPYFNLPGLFSDGEWVISRFPAIRLCKGQLLAQLLKCRLLILDHHGTVLLEALAANIPMVLYWNKSFWPMTDACNELLQQLESCGIWHDSPQKAAKKVKDILENPRDWFMAREVQTARLNAQKLLARTADADLDKIWIEALKNL